MLNASPMARSAFAGSDLQLHQQGQQTSTQTSRSNSTSASTSTSTSFDYPRKPQPHQMSTEKSRLEKKRAREAAVIKERASFYRAAGTVFSLK